jgi:succinate---hydroxymethylglutarate CoA-transferase
MKALRTLCGGSLGTPWSTRAQCISSSLLWTERPQTRKKDRRHNLRPHPRKTISNLSQPAQPNGALQGVKILDLSRVLAAPLCTQILADYGADVIKVEDLTRGDDTRYFKARTEKGAWKADAEPMSHYFASINRNKRSICLDLKQERGREVLLKLVKESDVVVENFRPGTMEKLGIGYEVLREANPRIVHASVSGYGADGPASKRAGYDMIAGAEAGLIHVTGERDGPPMKPGLGLTDMTTGLFIHGAIVSALYARERTGKGQRVDTSLFESQIALLINVGMAWLNLGEEAERWGMQHPSVVPYDAFKTKDLYFVCGATNDKQFTTFCRLLGCEELVSDPRFKTNADRNENRKELAPILNEKFKAKTTDEWLAAFEGSGMPYAPINTMERVFAHPQAKAREMIKNVPFEATQTGGINLIGPAVKFSDTKTSFRRPPPLLGQHTAEVLREVGVSEEELGDLRQMKVIPEQYI